MNTGKDVHEKVALKMASFRLGEFVKAHGKGPFKASTLAGVIWKYRHFKTGQGAGAAATRVLKRVGWKWMSTKDNWGWTPSGAKRWAS